MISSTPSDRRWTQTDITVLRERSRAGADVDALATDLQRTEGDVMRMMVRLHLAAPAASSNVASGGDERGRNDAPTATGDV